MCSFSMSVVREILGVQKNEAPSSSLAAVISSISHAAPKDKPRKRKSIVPKEVRSLRDSESLKMGLTPTVEEPMEICRSWKWAPFKNSARADGLCLSHWDYNAGREDYAAVKNNVRVQPLQIPNGSKIGVYEIGEIKYLFELIEIYSQNFHVIADRYDYNGHSRTVEEIKEMYYSLYTLNYPNKKVKYSATADLERKALLEERLLMTAFEGVDKIEKIKNEEKMKLNELNEISNSIKQIDSNCLFFEKFLQTPPVPPTPSSKGSKPFLASSEKKVPGIDLVWKHLKGIHLENLMIPNCGGSKELTTVMSNSVDFSAIDGIPSFCYSFNSRKFLEFFDQFNEIYENEKNLILYSKGSNQVKNPSTTKKRKKADDHD
jgi:hypothetical protein